MKSNNIKKIAFFGASVTSQSKGNGYFDYLIEFFNQDSIELSRFSYSACHFNDAGFFFHQEVINKKPDICIFEWNTTGLGKFSKSKLDIVIKKMLEHNIAVGFLILPRINTNLFIDRDSENQIIELEKNYHFNLLDLRVDFDFKTYLRDEVHTNPDGAKYYAQKIYEWLKNIDISKIDNIKFLENANSNSKQDLLIENLDYKFLVKDRLSLQMKMLKGGLNEIAISTIVGPYSPVAEISTLNGRSFRWSFWDQWCHYERFMIISLTEYLNLAQVDEDIFCTLDLKIISDDPNYSQCEKENIWVKSSDRYLNISCIHASNIEVLKIESDGVEIFHK